MTTNRPTGQLAIPTGLCIALETTPHLPGHVIAALQEPHKRWSYGARALATSLPITADESLTHVTDLDEVDDADLRRGLQELLSDCCGVWGIEDPSEPLPIDGRQLVRVVETATNLLEIGLLSRAGDPLTLRWMVSPASWKAGRSYKGPFDAVKNSAVQEALVQLHITQGRRVARAQRNLDALAEAFRRLENLLEGLEADGAVQASVEVNGDDAGTELHLASKPGHAHVLLKTLDGWLSQRTQPPDAPLTFDETTRALSVRLRGTTPYLFLAWLTDFSSLG
ncbi:hypothetical protein ACFWBX_09065 [Streptomyces sp. NPDC059991]|uniref:hypothetical protein n=1 Tax=Streptomyces sp. NPDC059991 TaxID=3347028 RepID=UPI0036B0A187